MWLDSVCEPVQRQRMQIAELAGLRARWLQIIAEPAASQTAEPAASPIADQYQGSMSGLDATEQSLI